MLKKSLILALRLSLSVIISSTILNNYSLLVFAQSKSQKLNKEAQAKNKKTTPTRLTYSLEIDDIRNRDGEIITLAIDAVTVIHCPEPPMQIVVGNEAAVAMKETLPTQTDIYITATKADVVSNLVIEFKNSKSILHFRTTTVAGGPLPGSYTGEVFVKPHKTNSELAQTRKEVERLNQEVVKLQNNLTQAQKEANEKLAQALTQNNTDLLKMLEQAAFRDKAVNSKPIELATPGHRGHVSITQVSRMIPSSKGNIVIFAVENDSRDTHSLDSIGSTNAKILTTFEKKTLTPGIYTYVAVLIDTTNTSNFDKEILFIVDSVPVKVRIS